VVAASSQPKPSPLTPREWEVEFRKAINADLNIHDDPHIPQLLSSSDDTFSYTADQVRRYVTDYWKETNEDRSLYGAELRQKLPSAMAGQKTTISLFETVIARLDKADFDLQAQSNIRRYLQMAHALLAQLQYMDAQAPAAFNTKSLGYAGDLQTLYSLHCFLLHRLGACSYDTLATLLDCGFTVEGIDKEVYDGKNLKNRLDGFRQNKPDLAQKTEAFARSIPRGKPRK